MKKAAGFISKSEMKLRKAELLVQIANNVEQIQRLKDEIVEFKKNIKILNKSTMHSNSFNLKKKVTNNQEK